MDPNEQETQDFKNWLMRHQTRILYTAVASSFIAMLMMNWGLRSHDRFLIEHGLYDEYYDYLGKNG